jgi:hypothetical protein
MIIELRILHARWKLLIENTCMLLENGNETVWNGTRFRVHGRVTNKGKPNYMEGIDIVKLNGRETETVKPAMPRTDLVTSTKPILPMDSSYPLLPCGQAYSCAKVFHSFRSSGG